MIDHGLISQEWNQVAWGNYETNLRFLSRANDSYPGIKAQVASGDALPFDAHMFDVVLSLDVFEHIRDSNRHLREVRRVLKPGGNYLLQTPNKWTNIPFEMLRQWKKIPYGSHPQLSYAH